MSRPKLDTFSFPEDEFDRNAIASLINYGIKNNYITAFDKYGSDMGKQNTVKLHRGIDYFKANNSKGEEILGQINAEFEARHGITYKRKTESKTINLLKKIIREEIKNLNEVNIERPDLAEDAKRYAAIANKMKVLEDELKSLEKEFIPLDQEFREILDNVEDVKDTFIKAGEVLIKIEKKGYDRVNMKYKEGFDWLLTRVNKTMKALVQEALDLSKSTMYIKSKIAVVGESKKILTESWMTKIVDFFKNKFKKIFGLTKQANSDLDKLDKMI